MKYMTAWCAGLCLLGGCGGDARVELSTADALQAVAGQMQRTIEEYHQEVSSFDDTRESAVVAAFITRVRKDANDEATVNGHATEFAAALRKIRTDRETEWSRRNAALDSVGVLREMSHGVQKLAVQSLGLQDEFKRYLLSWIEARQKAQAAATATAAQATTGNAK
jgi:hypothetical protein